MQIEEAILEAVGDRHARFASLANQKLASLLPGLRSVVIETSDHERWLAYIVEECEQLEPDADFVNLDYLASLAGFYNARYLFEMVKFEAIRVPVGRFETFLKPVFGDDGKEYAVTVLRMHSEPKFISNGNSLSSLDHHGNGNGNGNGNGHHHPRSPSAPRIRASVSEAFAVADKLALLHERCLPERPNSEVRTIIEENYQMVAQFVSDHFRAHINGYLEATLERNGRFFRNTDDTFAKFNTLFKTMRDLEETYPESRLPSVLCHGNLTAECVTTMSHRNEIAFIDHWEGVHYGSVAEDLSHFILTSLSPSDRRNNYMKVFRQYFYALVDTRPVKFKLADLKSFYLRFMKYSMFISFPTLAAVLNSDDFSDFDKHDAVQRWESVLDDAYDLHTEAYLSDNEDLLTVQNSEDRSVTEAVMRTRHSTSDSPLMP